MSIMATPIDSSVSFERRPKRVSFDEKTGSPTKRRGSAGAVPVRRSIFLPEWLNKMEGVGVAVGPPRSTEEPDNWLARALSNVGNPHVNAVAPDHSVEIPPPSTQPSLPTTSIMQSSSPPLRNISPTPCGGAPETRARYGLTLLESDTGWQAEGL